MGPPPPPPPPLALSSRPSAGRNDSGGSASSASTNQASPYAPPTNQLHASHTSHGSSPFNPNSLPNPYVPRGSDPTPTLGSQKLDAGAGAGAGPNAQMHANANTGTGSWDYRSIQRDRLPSSSSFHSHHSHSSELSPYSASDPRIPSPASPLLSPYDAQTQTQAQPQPHAQSQSHTPAGGYYQPSHTQPSSSPMSGGSGMTTPWGSMGYGPSPDAFAPLVQQSGPPGTAGAAPASASASGSTSAQGYAAGRPNGARSQSTHQVYPASQPATPAGKYELGPPPPMGAREQRSASLSSRTMGRAQGFREVMDWQDLRPVMNERPAGRRADPNRLGKFISVSSVISPADW